MSKRKLPKTFSPAQAAQDIVLKFNPKQCPVEFLDNDLRLVLRVFDEKETVLFEYDTGLSGYESVTIDLHYLARNLVAELTKLGVQSFYNDLPLDVLRDIRCHNELNEDDNSRDYEFLSLTLEQTLNQYLMENGINGFTSDIVAIAKLFGARDTR